MMKKILKIFSIIMVLMLSINVKAVELDIQSENAILINLNDDSVLYEKNSEEQVSIASLTKIMTAIVVLDNVDNLDQKVTLTYEDFAGLIEQNAAQAGFRVGQTVTYRDLLYGLLLPSGADAAQALARNVGGSVDDFVILMNKKAKELGLEKTNFANVTGLDDENNYSSVKDVSIMFKYAIKNKDFMEIIKKSKYTISDNSLTFHSTIKRKIDNYNLNMDYLIGGKTGTTYDAGLCLASIAKYNNVNYMLVTVKGPQNGEPTSFIDAKTIYEYFMNNYSYKTVVDKTDVLVTLDTKYLEEDEISFKSPIKLDMYLDNSFNKENIKFKYKGIKEISNKNNVGEKIGKVDIYYNGKLLQSVDIVLLKKPKFSLKKYLKENIKIIILLFSSIVIVLILLKLIIKK